MEATVAVFQIGEIYLICLVVVTLSECAEAECTASPRTFQKQSLSMTKIERPRSDTVCVHKFGCT
eukprot:249166-Amphidinium_carterae.1